MMAVCVALLLVCLPVTVPQDDPIAYRTNVLSADQWAAIELFSEDQRYIAARTGWCEGRLNPTSTNGTHIGSWQVNPYYWGQVPDDLPGQAYQVREIVALYGWGPWDARNGCPDWPD